MRVHVEIAVEPDVHLMQRGGPVVGDRELEPGDPVVAGIRERVGLLVHREAERYVHLAPRVEVHGLGLVVGVVAAQHLLPDQPQVLVDLPVPVVVLAVQDLLVDRPVPVVVHAAQAAELAVPGFTHGVLGRQRGTELQQRSARDPRRPLGIERAHPQGRVVQQLLAAPLRVLERRVG